MLQNVKTFFFLFETRFSFGSLSFSSSSESESAFFFVIEFSAGSSFLSLS
jgi:hypothetical protein